MGDVRVSEELQMWRLANPALGVTVNEEAIAEFIAEDRS